MPTFARQVDAIPVVNTTAERAVLFQNPEQNQRVQNLETGAIERWTNGSWTPDYEFAAGGAYNVKTYGAVGDGVTNDTTAIQAALAACTAGSVLFFPAGTYVVTATLTIPVSRITIRGEGAEVSRLIGTMATTTHSVLVASSLDDVTITDLGIGGSHSWGVLISGGSGHRILRNRVSGGVYRDGSGSKGGGLFVENASDVVVDGNTFESNGVTDQSAWFDILFNYGTYSVTDSRITGNHCKSTNADINICTFDCRRVLVQDNIVTGADTPSSPGTTGGYGIAMYRNSGFSAANAGEHVITGNHVYAVDGTGIYVQSMRDCVVTGNLVEDSCSAQADTTLTVAGIALHDSAGCVVSGNKILDSGQSGVGVTTSVTNANKCVVTGNQIENCTKWGVCVRGVVEDLMVSGNTIINCVRDGVGSYSDVAATRVSVIGNNIRTITGGGYRGVYAAPTATNWTIKDNTISDLSGGGQAITATSTTNVVDGWSGSKTWDPGSISSGAQGSTTVTVTGAALGDRVAASFSLDLQVMPLVAYVSAANTVTVVLQNLTGSPVDLGSGTLTAWVKRNC